MVFGIYELRPRLSLFTALAHSVLDVHSRADYLHTERLYMKNKTTPALVKQPAQKQIIIILNNDSDEEWIRGYNEYCQKTGKQLSVSPAYQLRDDGTFSTVIRRGVVRNP
jgi:hypothetical protein